MKRSFWLVLFIFCVSIFMAGCTCLPGSPCAQVVETPPPPQPAVVAPAPPPPAPQYVPPPKVDRN